MQTPNLAFERGSLLLLSNPSSLAMITFRSLTFSTDISCLSFKPNLHNTGRADECPLAEDMQPSVCAAELNEDTGMFPIAQTPAHEPLEIELLNALLSAPLVLPN